MRVNVTKGYDKINKEASVGTSRKNVVIVANGSKKLNRPPVKSRKCGGCSRRRRST